MADFIVTTLADENDGGGDVSGDLTDLHGGNIVGGAFSIEPGATEDGQDI